jgi:hypothetical protein
MDTEDALRTLAEAEDFSQAAVLKKVIDKLGGLDNFAGMVAQDYIDAPAQSNSRARIGTTLLQALLRHGDEEVEGDEDIESIEAELKELLNDNQ